MGGALVLLAFVAGLIIGGNLISATEKPSHTEDLLGLSDAFAEIAEKINPSVVHIACTELEKSEAAEDDTVNHDDDSDDEDLENQYGFGSGVIIDASGYILTSNHVIESAGKIEVKLSNEKKFVAKLVGQDKETDLALIKVDSDTPLPAAPMGDSDRLKPGQWVMAIGNPFVYDHTVTVGVISALNRDLGTNIFDNFIQTDAAINFGNSGGPLLNVKGEVIGINTLISSQGTGIGFAIPINTAREIIPQLKQKGKVSRGFLGLVPQQVTPELQQSLELKTAEGVIVSSIQKGSPADHAGLKRYDVILEIDAAKVESEDHFRRIVADTAPGKKLHMKLLRDGKLMEIDSEVAERPESPVLPQFPPKNTQEKTGLKVTDLTRDLRDRYELDDEIRGILVQHVNPGSAADNAGLQKRDVIIEVNKKPVNDASAFLKQLEAAKSGEVFLLYVLRDDAYQFLTLSIP